MGKKEKAEAGAGARTAKYTIYIVNTYITLKSVMKKFARRLKPPGAAPYVIRDLRYGESVDNGAIFVPKYEKYSL